MTGTPRATASLIAPVTLPASEQEISAAVAPSLTAWASRCAWTWPSSDGGVSHTISIGTLCFCDSSLAAASAPVLAERKTGLVELLAIIAILIPWTVDFSSGGLVAWSPAGVHAAAIPSTTVVAATATAPDNLLMLIVMSLPFP